jgi:hypothetical protein
VSAKRQPRQHEFPASIGYRAAIGALDQDLDTSDGMLGGICPDEACQNRLTEESGRKAKEPSATQHDKTTHLSPQPAPQHDRTACGAGAIELCRGFGGAAVNFHRFKR